MIRNLAAIGFVSPRADEWRAFGPEVLGAELAPDGPDGAVRLRVDDAAFRITIRPGERDDLAFLQWQVDDVGAAGASIASRAGVDVEDATFVDPFGFRH